MKARLPYIVGLLVAAQGACSPVREVDADVPSDVQVAGVVVVDESGAVVDGAPLAPWGPGLAVVTEPGQRALVLGFTSSQMADYPGALNASDRLRAAQGCDNRLPVPAYAAQLVDGALVSFDPARAPMVTTDAVKASCDNPLEFDWSVDVSCFGERCAPVVSAVSACTVQLDLSACGGQTAGATARATVGPTGQVCIETGELGHDCVAGSDPAADAVVTCGPASDPCDIFVYRDPRAPLSPLTTQTRKWRDAPPAVPGVLGSRAWIAARFMRSGYANGMVLLDDRVVITGPRNPSDGCSEFPSRTYVLEQSDLREIQALDAPPCTLALMSEGQTYLAAYYEDGVRWRIARFDRDGTELTSADAVDSPLDSFRRAGPSGDGYRVPNWRPQVLLQSPDEAELWLILGNTQGFEPLPGSALVRLDPEDLSRLGQEILPNWHRSYHGVVTRSDEYALLSEWSLSVGWFRPGTDEPMATVEVLEDSPVKNVYYSLTPLEGDQLVVAALGRAPAIFVDRSRELGRAAHPAGEVEQMMVRFVDWDGATKLGIGMQTIDNGRRQAIATLLDTNRQRFLPGVWVLGEGMPSFVETDDQGRNYVLLPWTAEIIRIDPQ